MIDLLLAIIGLGGLTLVILYATGDELSEGLRP